MRFAIGLLALAAFAQDAATTLDQVRDKVLVAASNLPKYVCTETIDRSYYSRKSGADTPPSCEKMPSTASAVTIGCNSVRRTGCASRSRYPRGTRSIPGPVRLHTLTASKIS